MRRGRGQGRAAHGAQRAARHRNNGRNINTIDSLTTTRQHLQYEEIIAGMGYEISKKQQREKLKSSNESNNEEEDGEDCNSDIENIERSKAANKAACWFVPRLGNMTQDRPEGVFRLAGGNLNSASSKDVRERKISYIHRILETWDVQGGGFSEIGIDWQNLQRTKRLDSWLQSGPDEYRTSAAHNQNEHVKTSLRQQGGIALFAGKEVRQYITKATGDFRGLGRWNSWLIQADPCHRTRIIVAYQVGQVWQGGIRTIYQQHARYMNLKDIPGTPRNLFQEDMVAAITKWRERGERLLIFIDMNEHILHGVLPKKLFQLGLQEATHKHWDGPEPRTFVYGDGQQIDGVYHTPDLEIASLMLLSFHEGVGDHRTVIIDVTTSSAIGTFEWKVITPQARRLATRNKPSVKSYIKFVTKECWRHRLQQKLDLIASQTSEGKGDPG
jgi:hypothetical protein